MKTDLLRITSLNAHEDLLIGLRKYIDLMNMHKEIEVIYKELFKTINHIKYLISLFIICGLTWIFFYFTQFIEYQIFINCCLYSLTFCSIFRIIVLYFKFSEDLNKLITYKNWILEKDKDIPKLIDNPLY